LLPPANYRVVTDEELIEGLSFPAYRSPFYLKGVDRLLPPANYRVVTDEELIEGLSFPAYRRASTVIFVPAETGCAVEMVTIDPSDLQAVMERDARER
jgi:hypothetical protein